MRVNIPGPLRSYTHQQSVVEESGATVAEVLRALDRRYAGFRFRIVNEQDGIREHIRIFVNQEQVRTLDVPLESTDEIHIICAISGG